MKLFAILLGLLPALAHAQAPVSEPSSLYRVFLVDGSILSSYGEWARVEDRLIFTMPVTPGADPDQLQLVSIAAGRVDWRRTNEYARVMRAANYAAHSGEADFARLSADVARVLDEVALVKDPTARLVAAERARRALADWPDTHYGYRAKDVHEILGSLDEVIVGLRVAAGLGRFDLALTANTTPPPPAEVLLPAPGQREIVEQLMAAASIADIPAEKVSLLQTVVGILDRLADRLPAEWSAPVRATALGAIAEEQKVEAAYARLRESTLTAAAGYVSKGDVRGLERLRGGLAAQDQKLGARRPGDVLGLAAAIGASLDAAYQLRLAQDQWLLRVDRLRAYQRATGAMVSALSRAYQSLDDIRALAGPAPVRLRPLAELFAREGRLLSNVDPPAELAAIHSLFRSASEMAQNAARLRLDAVEAADLDIARRASSAAAGALMMLAKAKADLDAALRPPIVAAAAQ